MKKLHESLEVKWQFTSYAELHGMKRSVQDPQEVILLLHGLGERGKRMYRKLVPYLPENAIIIAPNGPFPIQRNKEGRISYGHSWYFYDKFEKKYFITQDLAKFWLRDLLEIENPNSLPVTIIGFSQGGYLAPLAGKEIKETKLIIGLACEFRTTLIHENPPFPLHAVHGDKDEIVPMNSAIKEIEQLKTKGIHVDFHSVKEAGHEITPEMGKTVESILRSYGKRSL